MEEEVRELLHLGGLVAFPAGTAFQEHDCVTGAACHFVQMHTGNAEI